MYAEGVPATSADIHSEKNYNNSLKLAVIGSQEYHGHKVWKEQALSGLKLL